MSPRVRDLMTEDVITCEHDTPLERVAELMLQHDIGSVVITNDGAPYGMITESDIIHASYHAGETLSEIPTTKVASHPLVTIEPERVTRLVVKRMRDERVKKLVVVDEREICGIITTQDLIDHYGKLTRDLQEIRHNRQRRTEW